VKYDAKKNEEPVVEEEFKEFDDEIMSSDGEMQ